MSRYEKQASFIAELLCHILSFVILSWMFWLLSDMFFDKHLIVLEANYSYIYRNDFATWLGGNSRIIKYIPALIWSLYITGKLLFHAKSIYTLKSLYVLVLLCGLIFSMLGFLYVAQHGQVLAILIEDKLSIAERVIKYTIFTLALVIGILYTYRVFIKKKV